MLALFLDSILVSVSFLALPSMNLSPLWKLLAQDLLMSGSWVLPWPWAYDSHIHVGAKVEGPSGVSGSPPH